MLYSGICSWIVGVLGEPYSNVLAKYAPVYAGKLGLSLDV